MLFQAFENVLWLWWSVFAWWVRVRMILIEFFFSWVADVLWWMWDVLVFLWDMFIFILILPIYII